ncbi:MAG TPA: DUF6496 domain-containing protein [Alphaproteobacteria bacterium]|nr:DUF6496 domain-containing protein [Alphaproteobacteria bacterium]
MASHQSRAQRETVERVMHEYKEGELKIRGNGPKVKNPKQAIAIALHEAGATNQESARKNRQNLARTKAKERRGETAEAETEGKAAQQRTMRKADRRYPGARSEAGRSRRDGSEKTRSELYAEARKRQIPGRSKMNKAELQRALAH